MNNAKVGIILGSASDLPHARKIGDTLKELGVAHIGLLGMNNMIVDQNRPYTVERLMERGLSVASRSAQHDAEETVLPIGQECCQFHDNTARHLREHRYMSTTPHLSSVCFAKKHVDILRLLVGQLKTVCCIPLNS